jgi:hypothetical protein
MTAYIIYNYIDAAMTSPLIHSDANCEFKDKNPDKYKTNYQ